MRIGILGGGNISGTHARAALSVPGVEIAAFCGPSRDKVARLAREYGGGAYTDTDTFLAHRPMDFVAIGSPSGVHAQQGIAAVKRGLHVLVEKPIDITTERADELITAADRAGVRLGVFFQDRLRPSVAEMKRLVVEGILGKPVIISGRVKWYRPPEYYSQSRWRGTLALDGGGALMNQAIHTVDLLLWLFGPVARVSGATATRIHSIEAEDTAVALLEFESGALGTIEATTSAYPGYDRRIEMTGAEGTVILEHDRLARVDLRSGAPAAHIDAADTTASASSPVVSDASAHARVIEDFVRAIRTRTPPVCDGREGRRSVELVQAIYRSAREKRPVAVAV